MLYRNEPNSRVIRVALIEPNEADAYWFGLVARQSESRIEVSHYPTGMVALREWRQIGHSNFDLLIVADVLPMLSLREFVDAAKVFQPAAQIIVTGERDTASALGLAEYDFCAKPISVTDLGHFAYRDQWSGVTEIADQFFSVDEPVCG
jgi:hypothetical protein